MSAAAQTCGCGRPTRDEAYVCDECADELVQALAEIPWAVRQLEITRLRLRAAPIETSGSSAVSPLPWSERASCARRRLARVLAEAVAWCEQNRIRHSSPSEKAPADDYARARWLHWRVDGMTLHPEGWQISSRITDAVEACRVAVDLPPERWYAGPCACGTDLYALNRSGPVECRGCGTTYDVSQRRDWLLGEAEDRLLNAADLARAVSWLGAEPLTPGRVRKWASRKRILARGHDGAHPLYRVGDAIDLLAEDTRRRDERRGR